jgi:hypothetical protein
VLFEVSLYRPLDPAADEALGAAVDRQAGFLGLPAATAITLIAG